MEFLNALSPLTQIFSGLIIILTLYFHGPVYSLRTVNTAPSILTSLGILGTFLGVALGLMDFNSADIEASVPGLIEGLKTAFWSSIVGLIGAMTIKLRHVLNHVRGLDGTKKVTGATLDDLATLLGYIRKLLDKSNLSQLGEQMQNNQVSFDKNLRELTQVLNKQQADILHYQSEVAQKNTQALQDALKSLLMEFNEKIKVEYGENFKHLNTAVESMLVWQQSYKEELNKLIREQEANGQVLDKATEAYKTMVEHTQAFNQVSASLGEVMQGLQQQSNALGAYLEGLAKLVSKASDGLPALEGRVFALTEELAQGIQISHQQMNDLLLKTGKHIESTVIQVTQDMSVNIETLQDKQKNLLIKMLDRNEQQLTRMDQALEYELTHSLQSFGFQLAALSEKFVNDYMPLTDKLRDVVQLAEQINSSKDS